jgi:anti-sigma factor RsiW
MPEGRLIHPDDEVVEAYAMGRLEEPVLSEYEEHLLICDRCQERLQQIDEYVDAMRRATRRLAE